jgi:hypothetical protein
VNIVTILALSLVALTSSTPVDHTEVAISLTVSRITVKGGDTISNLLGKSVRCGANQQHAAVYHVSAFKKAAEVSFDHVLDKTTLGLTHYPHRYGVLEPKVSFHNVACRRGQDLHRFPITRDEYTGGGIKDIADRVMIRQNRSKAVYCGVITHLGAPGNSFGNCRR